MGFKLWLDNFFLKKNEIPFIYKILASLINN